MKNQYHYIVSIIVCTILFLSNASQLRAQNNPSEVVASFGHALSSWCNTNQVSYRERIDQLCSGPKKCRVEDVIHAEYQKGRGLTNYETFVLDSYLNMFQSLIPRSLNYKMSNVKVVGSDEMPDGTLTFITADIALSGAINKSVTDLFLVRNNKISGIYSYSSYLGFSHLNGSLIKALQIGRYSFSESGGFRNGYAKICNEAYKHGLIDTRGEVIIPCIWAEVFYFGGDFALGMNEDGTKMRTYDLRFNGKVVPLNYYNDGLGRSDRFQEGFLAVGTLDDRFGFLKEDDTEYNVSYEYDYASQFTDGYAYVIKNEVPKIINKKFETVVESSSRYIICDNFYEGLAKVYDVETGKVGFINEQRNIVIPCVFDDTDHFSEGLCAVYKYDIPSRSTEYKTTHYGFINKSGEIVVPITFDNHTEGCVTIRTGGAKFKDGYMILEKPYAKGSPVQETLIGYNGKPLPGFTWYESIGRFSNGLALFRTNGHYGYLKRNGQVAIKPSFDIAFSFENGYACVGEKINGEVKFGCINTDGILVIPYIYDSYFFFENGIALVSKDEKIGLIDVYGNSSFLTNTNQAQKQSNLLQNTKEAAIKSSVNQTHNGHEYVDLGLSVMWATCNVGADNPYEYGDYFAWGEIDVYSKDHIEFTKFLGGKGYKWSRGDNYFLTKYCTDTKYGILDNKKTLEVNDDVAHISFGGKWCIPTKKHLVELCENCIWQWVCQNGIDGYKVISKINNNSIFLPAAGYKFGDVNAVGFRGYYWTSSLHNHPGNAWRLDFGKDKVQLESSSRLYGHSIRPVFSPK